ncbi:hypothetical protein Vretifemale_17434, partial [Volvox reticuliferus]
AAAAPAAAAEGATAGTVGASELHADADSGAARGGGQENVEVRADVEAAALGAAGHAEAAATAGAARAPEIVRTANCAGGPTVTDAAALPPSAPALGMAQFRPSAEVAPPPPLSRSTAASVPLPLAPVVPQLQPGDTSLPPPPPPPPPPPTHLQQSLLSAPEQVLQNSGGGEDMQEPVAAASGHGWQAPGAPSMVTVPQLSDAREPLSPPQQTQQLVCLGSLLQVQPPQVQHWRREPSPPPQAPRQQEPPQPPLAVQQQIVLPLQSKQAGAAPEFPGRAKPAAGKTAAGAARPPGLNG